MSVTLTISNFDNEIYRRLQAEALRQGSDVETVARSTLSENLPAADSEEAVGGKKYRDLSSLAGTWTEEEAREFLESIAPLRRIDPELWQ